MCRIAVLPTGYTGDKMVKLLNHLEKSKGGDGNGFGWYDSHGEAQALKGLKVGNKTINRLRPASGQVLYHTRIASAGLTNDENTQPFITKGADGKPFILCHNGTWSTHEEYKRILLMLGEIGVRAYKDWSDTKFMAWLIETQGEDRLDLPSSGVWVKFYGDSAIVHVRTGGDFCAYKLGKKWIYASEFPEDEYKKVWEFKADSIVSISAEKGFEVLEGEEPTHEENTSIVCRNYGYNSKGANGAVKSSYWGRDGKQHLISETVQRELWHTGM